MEDIKDKSLRQQRRHSKSKAGEIDFTKCPSNSDSYEDRKKKIICDKTLIRDFFRCKVDARSKAERDLEELEKYKNNILKSY